MEQKKIEGQGGEDLTVLPVQAFPALSVIRTQVQSELNRRKESFGEKNLPSTVWCRLISNSRPASTNHRRGKNSGQRERDDVHILMGAGTLVNGKVRGGFEPIYGYRRSGVRANEQLLRPTPGIENISITMEGELGSLRRAKITWNAPSIFDLEELSPYFLTPGATAIIEWGWGIFNVGQVAPLGFSDKTIGTEMLGFFKNPRKLYKRSLDAQGLYDAMLGYITNFEWSANQDGSFTCLTEITTMGELIAGLNLREQRNSTDPKKVDVAKTILQFFQENLSQVIADFKKPKEFQKKGIDVIKAGKNPDKPDTYISWGFLEDMIINPTMAISNEGKVKGFFPFKVDSTDSFISNDSKLISNDDNILINKGQKDLLDFNDPRGDKFTGVLRNIYIKVDYIKEIFEKAETLKNFFALLTTTANNASSNIWNLGTYINPLSENLQIIDKRYTNNLVDTVKPRTVFSFGGFGKETILKDLNLVSKITSQLAMTYIFAKNKAAQEENVVLNAKDDMGIKTLYGGFNDLVAFELQTANKEAAGGQAKDAKDNADEISKKRWIAEATTIQNLSNAVKSIDKNSEKIFVPETDLVFTILDPNGKEALSRYLHRKSRDNKRRKQQIFAPLELNATIDGIGGIIPGNIFRVENIPEVYEKNGVFQVIRVEHDISPETWNTKIVAYFKILEFDEDIDKLVKVTTSDITEERGDA